MKYSTPVNAGSLHSNPFLQFHFKHPGNVPFACAQIAHDTAPRGPKHPPRQNNLSQLSPVLTAERRTLCSTSKAFSHTLQFHRDVEFIVVSQNMFARPICDSDGAWKLSPKQGIVHGKSFCACRCHGIRCEIDSEPIHPERTCSAISGAVKSNGRAGSRPLGHPHTSSD
jgi:hypothetical protein